jgi:hypothetical protein
MKRNGTRPRFEMGTSAGLLLGIGAAACAAYLIAVRPWHLQWGATQEEFDRALLGDEWTPEPTDTATHAITIQAPISAVWPWLVQVGQDKGGFYSYTWLENLVGCHMHNADRILPEFQTLKVGDKVWLHPKAPPLPVLFVEPERALVLGSNTDEPGTWGFYLQEISPDFTRLLIRSRTQRKPGALRWLGHYALFEPAHFVMERKMLLGIKQRVEAAHQEPRVLPDGPAEENPLADVPSAVLPSQERTALQR